MNITSHVLVAYDAGVCTIPTRTDGSKAPEGVWKAFQTERPTRMQVSKWFATEHPGVGAVCGAVSGNLTMLELEGRAVALGLAKRIGAQALAMGAAEAWRILAYGYVEQTPSGGLHFYYRTAEPAHPNTRLARTADNEVLIETRGEGGFSVMAPSHGPVHPSGNPWVVRVGTPATIPVLSATQAEALFTVCATFDEAPAFVPTPAPPRDRKLSVPMFNGHTLGASWMDDVETHLAHITDMPALLAEYGWRHDHDAGGRRYYTRPDKDTGTSGVINEAGRLVVFSTSTPFEPFNGTRAPSYGLLDIIATYEHAGDREAAARRIATEAGIFDARDASGFGALKRSVPIERHVRIGPLRAPESPESADTPDGGLLPPEFWHGHVGLEAVRAAAITRMVAPTALLHVCLARVAAIAPFTIVIPPMIGTAVNLSYLTALVGGAETGKSSAVGVATELLPAPSHVLDGLPPGSGEGLADVLFEYISEDDPATGKRVRVRRQTKHNGFVYVDEGQTLNALAGRGSTLLPTLRSVYSGQPIGNTNAREETRRIVPAGRYAFGVVVSFQPTALGPLFDEREVGFGTPQRFTYADATDPDLRHGADDAADLGALAPIAWRAPLEGRRALYGGMSRLVLSYPAHVVGMVRARRRAIASRELVVDAFDAHGMLTRLKVAGLLAVFGGHLDVDDETWARSGMVMSASGVVRDRARAAVAHDAERTEVHHAERLGRRAVTADKLLTTERVERAAIAIARKVAEAGETTVAAVRRSFSSASPHRTHFDEGLSAALGRQWITLTNEPTTAGGSERRTLKPGQASP